MSAISETMLQENVSSARELAVLSVRLAAQEAAKDDPSAMSRAEYASIKANTAVINRLRELLRLERIDDPESQLSHQDVINAVCVAANAAGTASTKGFHSTLDARWQALAPHVRGEAAGQMARRAVTTALDTAHRLLTEVNEAPIPPPPDPGRQKGPPRGDPVPGPDRPGPGTPLPIGISQNSAHRPHLITPVRL